MSRTENEQADVIADLRALIPRIQAESRAAEAVQIMSNFLAWQTLVRLDENQQSARCFALEQKGDLVRLRDFEAHSQYPRIKEMAAEYIRNLQRGELSNHRKTRTIQNPEPVVAE